MTPLYILGGFPYEATPSRKHGVIFRLVKAARRKPSPGQMALFDMPSKPKPPKRNKAKEGDTRTNRAGNKEVLRSGRWRLLEPKVKRPKAGLRLLSDDAIATTKQPLRLRPKPSSVAAGAWSDALKPTPPTPLTLGDEDIFEPDTDTPLTNDIDYAYNQEDVNAKGGGVMDVASLVAVEQALKELQSKYAEAQNAVEANVIAQDMNPAYDAFNAAKAQALQDWGTSDFELAQKKEEALALSEAPAAFNGNTLYSLESFGNSSFVSSSKLFRRNWYDGTSSIEFDSHEHDALHWGDLLALGDRPRSQVQMNPAMEAWIAEKRAELEPSLSQSDFESKWSARLAEPKQFLGGDKMYPLNEWKPSTAASLIFGRVGSASFAHGWSMNGTGGAGRILGMTKPEIAEYYQDLSRREGIPISVRALYQDMSKEVIERMD